MSYNSEIDNGQLYVSFSFYKKPNKTNVRHHTKKRAHPPTTTPLPSHTITHPSLPRSAFYLGLFQDERPKVATFSESPSACLSEYIWFICQVIQPVFWRRAPLSFSLALQIVPKLLKMDLSEPPRSQTKTFRPNNLAVWGKEHNYVIRKPPWTHIYLTEVSNLEKCCAILSWKIVACAGF